MKTKLLLLFGIVAVGAVAVIVFRKSEAPANSAVAIKTSPVATEIPGPVSNSNRGQTIVDRQQALRLSREEPASLLVSMEQMMASTNLDSREFAMTNLLPALVLRDSFAAGQFAETNTLEAHDAVLQQVARLLAAQDLTNAVLWATGLKRDYERESAMTDVCLQVAESNPAEAVRLRESLLSENQGFDALEDLMQKWAEKDLAAAQAWIAAHPRDARRDQVIGRVAYVQAQTSPKEAAYFVVENMTPSDAQIEAAVSVLHQWGQHDLAAATAWANAFPEGPLRTRALQELSTITR